MSIAIRIKCGVSANYAFMRGLLEDFLPQGQGFVLDVLVPMRSRTVGNGKCCWCAYYVSTLIPIPTKSDFLNAKKTLTLNKPFDAEIVCFGRYAEQGICITYCNVKCCCVKDFSHVLTQFPLGEFEETLTLRKWIFFKTFLIFMFLQNHGKRKITL